MSGGGSASSSRSRQESESSPWIGQQPFLTDVFGQAQSLYNRGPAPYYPGQTYADFNDIQQGAMGATLNRAQGSPQEGMLGGYLMNQLGQPQINLGSAGAASQQVAGGVGAGQQMLAGAGGPGIGAASRFAGRGSNPFQGPQDVANFIGSQVGGNDPYSQAAQQLGNAQSAGIAQSALGQTARGDFIGGNPYLDAQFDQASRRVSEQFQDTVAPTINATFGAAGRTGSGIHQEMLGDAAGELGDTLGGLGADIYGNAYARERANQLQAGQQLGSLGLGAAGLGSDMQLGRAGQALDAYQFGQDNALGQNALAADIYNQGQNRQMQAGDSLLRTGLDGAGQLGDLYSRIGNQQQGAAGLVPTLTALQYGNIDRAQDVGDRVQGQTQNAINDDLNRFNYEATADQNLLNQYAQIIMQQQLNQSSSSGRSNSKSGGFGIGG